MNPDVDAIRPSLRFLSEDQRGRIHQAVLQVLENTGMEIQHPEGLALLADAGCRVEGDRAHLPPNLVERALESAPRSIAVADRLNRPAMDLGGFRSYFGTGSDLLFTLEPGTRQRHRSVLDDVRRAARVADALDNLDFIMSLATPSDVPPAHSYLLSVQAMMETSLKPIVCTADNRRDLCAMWDMAAILRGGEQALRESPYLVHYAEPVSPLKHPFPSVDKLLFCADKGLPAIYSPAPIAGSTAPMTIAGHVVQGLAECLCGLVMHQLQVPGAPFLMGMGPAVLDMATVECSYNAPEYYLSYLGEIEMAHHYDLPCWGYAGHSDSQIPDGQAALEAGMITFLATMAGANLCHDVGYLDFGRTGSLEQVIIGAEIIDQMRRLGRGIPVNEDTLAVDVIADAHDKRHFLGHKHTRRHVRGTQWRPQLLSRLGFEQWQQQGALSLRERANARLDQILAEHLPEPLTAEQADAMQARVELYLEGGE